MSRHGQTRVWLGLLASAGVHLLVAAVVLGAAAWLTDPAETVERAAAAPVRGPAVRVELFEEPSGGTADQTTRGAGAPGVRFVSERPARVPFEVALIRVPAVVKQGASERTAQHVATPPGAASAQQRSTPGQQVPPVAGTVRGVRAGANTAADRSAPATADLPGVAEVRKDHAAPGPTHGLRAMAETEAGRLARAAPLALRTAPDGERVSSRVAQPREGDSTERRVREVAARSQDAEPTIRDLREPTARPRQPQPFPASPHPPAPATAGPPLESSPGAPTPLAPTSLVAAGTADGPDFDPGSAVVVARAAVPDRQARWMDRIAASAMPLGGGAGFVRGLGDIAFGDPNEKLVIERIAHVARLYVGESALRGGGRREAKLRFRIDSRGYVQDFVLSRPSRLRAVDQSLELILHLAEPFPVPTTGRGYEIVLPLEAGGET